MSKSPTPFSIVMLGATGAVGGEALKALLPLDEVKKLSLLGRRTIELDSIKVEQHIIDIFDNKTYQGILAGHQTAICTLGVGQPSKVSRKDFIKIDKQAVIDFAVACKKAGVQHFELLSSVGVSAQSSSFFLRTKGELIEALKALDFDRLSIFKPSMILTPTNRYGIGQAITLAVWPRIQFLFFGSLKKYRGVKVATLGRAIAFNIFNKKQGTESLFWDDFQQLH